MRNVALVVSFCLAAAGVFYAAETTTFTAAQKSFWSLQPVKKPAVPAVKGAQAGSNPIDAFVLAKLEEKQLQPNKPADRITLLRRVTIDLTGLIPLPDDIQAFVNDKSPNAYEKVVNRLLDSPAMGKQFTRQEWELKVTEMLQEEPDVTRDERAAILGYLAANFRPGGRIYLNMAGAKDLQAALEVSAAEADAMVRYRQTQGDFKSFEDLKKVPGLDTSKLESRKARLDFLDT